MTTNAQVVPFSFQSHAIRTVVIDGNPWFICTDVAEALDYRDAHNAARCLDDDEKDTQIVSTPSGDQSLTIISESGLYALVLRSRKPEARKFAKWVTAEVLPAIRKTGSYTSPQVGAGETAKPNDSFVFRLKALSMSLTIERQLVNHFMAGGDEGARWLLDFTHDGKPYISEVPKDAHVRSLRQLADYLKAPDLMIENSRYADLAYLAQSIATRLAQDCTDYAETVTIYRKRQADLDAIANTLKHAKPRRKIAAAAQGDHV